MDDLDLRVQEATANNIDEGGDIAVGLSRQLPERENGGEVFLPAESHGEEGYARNGEGGQPPYNRRKELKLMSGDAARLDVGSLTTQGTSTVHTRKGGTIIPRAVMDAGPGRDLRQRTPKAHHTMSATLCEQP